MHLQSVYSSVNNVINKENFKLLGGKMSHGYPEEVKKVKKKLKKREAVYDWSRLLNS